MQAMHTGTLRPRDLEVWKMFQEVFFCRKFSEIGAGLCLSPFALIFIKGILMRLFTRVGRFSDQFH